MIHALVRLAAVFALATLQTIPAVPAAAPSARPFPVGESAQYDVKYGFIGAGSASMRVAGIDTVRGIPAYHFVFTVSGGVRMLGLTVRDTLQSWADTATLFSLRFHQDQREAGKTRVKRYEIYPDRRVYVEPGKKEVPSVENPLDDASFLYFVRTVKLEIGQTLEFNNYFKPESNPVKIRVLRRDTIDVPAGRFATIVVQPIIKTTGIFSEGGEAQIWLSDDSARLVVQMDAKFAIARLHLLLKSFEGSTTRPLPR